MKATFLAALMRKRREGASYLLASAFCVFVIVAAVPMILFCTALACFDRYVMPLAECLLSPRNQVQVDPAELEMETFLHGHGESGDFISRHVRAPRPEPAKGNPDVFLSS